MNRYAVSFVADLTVEIDAENPEAAKAILADAFALSNGVDPLANHKFHIDNTEVEIKTTVIQEWEVPEMEVEKI